MKRERWHIICEKDVGLFSLIQQVIAHIPMALSENRIPVVLFGKHCCYWVEDGYMEENNVWEYYFKPIFPAKPSTLIDPETLTHIHSHHPHFEYPGYFLGDDIFVSNNFGDHRALRSKALQIPHKWKDPDSPLRLIASDIIKKYIRPRPYILKKVEQFHQENMLNQFVIGVHVRATDVTDQNEHNIHRRGSYNFLEYVKQIKELLKQQPDAKVFVATDSMKALENMKDTFQDRVIYSSTVFHSSKKVTGTGPSGWVIPGYLASDSKQAAKNGEEAVIDYLLLSECQYLIHNGSGLARTALLKNPDLQHFNIHSRREYVQSLFNLKNGELLKFMKFSYQHTLHNIKKPIKRLVNWDKV